MEQFTELPSGSSEARGLAERIYRSLDELKRYVGPPIAAAILAFTMIAASLGAACARNPTEPASEPLGQPFDLRVGESAVVTGGLKVTFDRVVSDSRCPIDAICVSAGEAVLKLALSRVADATVEREVRVDSSSELSYLSYKIKAIALVPYPRSDRKTSLEEFLATFTITR